MTPELARRALNEQRRIAARRPTCAWIRGPLESGKTALLEWVERTTDERRVVRTQGRLADVDRDHLALQPLVRQLADVVERLDDEFASVLQSLGTPNGTDHGDGWIHASLLELLATAASERPLVVLIDDMHWVDQPSHEALAYVARRLVTEPVLFVITSHVRPDGAWWPMAEVLPMAGPNPITDLTPPADPGPTEREHHAPVEPDRHATLHADSVSGATRMSARLTQLPATTQAGLAVLALSGSAPEREVAAALAAVAWSPADVARCIRDGLLHDDGALHSPRVVAAACADASIAALAHDALADAVSDPLTASLHRLRGSTPLTDAQLVDACELAERFGDRSRRSEAIAVLVAAADRYERDDQRAAACRVLRVAAMLEATNGHWSRARQLFDRAVSIAPTAELQCTLYRSGAWCALWDGSTVFAEARRLAEYIDAVDARHVESPDGMARAWASLIALYLTTDLFAAEAAAERAPAHPLIDDDRLVLGIFRVDQAAIDRLPRHSADGDGPISYLDDLTHGAYAEMQLMHGRWRVVHDVQTAELERLTRHRVIGELGPSTSRAIYARCMLGEPAAAYGAALTAIEVVPADGSLLGAGAFAAAIVGSPNAATWAERCLRVARSHELNSFVIDGLHRHALVALAEERFDDAAEHLAECDAVMTRHGFVHPGFAYARGDIAEAYAWTGRSEEAARVVAELCIDGFASDWTRGLAARAEGVAGDRGAFDRSVALLTDSPWELARTQLTAARVAARDGLTDEAGRWASAAAEAFRRMGARPWADQARRLIVASGRAVDDIDGNRSAAGPLDSLSDRERVVALAVARGLSNKAVAAELFISIKTVEAHLQAIYRKLDLSSRTQLVAVCVTSVG